ncbi:thioesterase family protein [Glutamicibacter protophormiae]|uniref:thioesterase family protein n=1 Tax=Glutamicibacter protophormiae TaxID=37930 RepID=UPI002A81C2E5|nr:thioesterase family protein [Glutamicibacter protophormiae]WPR63122.1 thioesterase family protein [Glutamicibacter protophormiae]WPR69978.1 thioesterase family protein [Glutamicibacter protophormiae]
MTHQLTEDLDKILASGDFYFESLGEGRYRSSWHAQGAWNAHEQHMAPASGIMAHELEQFQPRSDMRIARLSFEIHGLIHAGEFEITTRMVRPGRTIELIEAEMTAKGRTSIVAQAWRVITGDSSAVAGVEDAPVVGPQDCEVLEISKLWPGGYIKSVEMRAAEGRRPGKGIAWLRTPYDLVDAHNASLMSRLIGLVDTANGVAPRVEPGAGQWMFPNLDLQIHMYRAPAGEWLGLEAQQSYGTDGIGLTSTVLHDESGPFGRAEQILTVRSR